MIRHVPMTQAKRNSHKNNLSITIATYFQSSITCEQRGDKSIKRCAYNANYNIILLCSMRKSIVLKDSHSVRNPSEHFDGEITNPSVSVCDGSDLLSSFFFFDKA